MKYNNRLKIQFNFNPIFQGIYGLFGYMLVIEAYTESTNIKVHNCKYFVYTGHNWNSLVKHIQENI
jgi:hypothetical protein